MKCDRLIPACALCHKLGKRCIYEEQVKTPLTRRYLTEVASELARTKALLQQIISKSDETYQVSSGAPIEDPVHLPNSQAQNLPSRMGNTRGSSEVPIQTQSVLCEAQHRSLGPEKPPQVTSGPLLETPTSPRNFGWDEINGGTGGDILVNSMASLPSASHEGGYSGLHYIVLS